MAQLDGSFYLQSQGPDIGQSFERGMRLGDMMRQRKIQDMELQKKQQIDDAMKSGIVTNPDGTQSFNSEMALGNLMKVDPLVAQEKKAQFQQQEIADEHFKADMTFNESMKALNNPAYYSTAVNKLISKGIISADQVPKEFDLGFVKNAAGRAGTAKDYLEGLLKEQHYKNEEENRKFDRNIQTGKLNQSKYEFEKELDLKTKKMQQDFASGNNLPIDKKHFVDTLSTQNAKKISIGNQIDATLETVKNASDDQKLSAYRQLIKTLNSTEGADAVGAEEAKRLAGRLEIAFGGLTSGNPGQFGRDLKGFEEQAANASAAMKTAVKSNQGLIDEAMGRGGPVKIKTEDMSGPVKMRDPKGNIRLIPADQVEAAKAAGGVPL